MKRYALTPILMFCSFVYAEAKLIDRVAAVVGDLPILESQIAEFQQQLKKSQALRNIYRIETNNPPYSLVLSRMVEEKVVHKAVEDLEIKVSETEVDSQIAGIAKQNRISIDQLKTSLAAEGIPFEAYRRNIQSQLERRNIFDRELRSSGGTSEKELRDLYYDQVEPEALLSVIQASAKKIPGIKEKISKEKMNRSKIFI